MFKNFMRFSFSVVLFLLLPGCQVLQVHKPKQVASVSPARVQIVLTPQNLLQVTFTFDRPVKGFKFLRDYTHFRTQSWTPLNKNIHIITNPHNIEIVKATDESEFQSASFEVRPLKELLNADYDPFISFAQGGAMIFTHHFLVEPVYDLKIVTDLKPNAQTPPSHKTSITFDSPKYKAGFFDGAMQSLPYDAIKLTGTSTEGIYVFIGDAPKTGSPILFMDARTPIWAHNYIEDKLPKVFLFLERTFGIKENKQPVLFVTRMTSEAKQETKVQGDITIGSNTKGIHLTIRGPHWEKPSFLKTEMLSKIIVHESIHLWNAPTNQDEDFPSIAWIYEGGAEGLRVKTETALGLRTQSKYQEYHEAQAKYCLEKYVPPQTMSKMVVDDSYQLVYFCGVLIALVTEQILDDHDYFSFWRELMKRARAKNMSYGSHDYWQLLEERSQRKDVIAKMHSFIETPLSDRRSQLVDLLKSSGVTVLQNEPLKFKAPELKIQL